MSCQTVCLLARRRRGGTRRGRPPPLDPLRPITATVWKSMADVGPAPPPPPAGRAGRSSLTRPGQGLWVAAGPLFLGRRPPGLRCLPVKQSVSLHPPTHTRRAWSAVLGSDMLGSDVSGSGGRAAWARTSAEHGSVLALCAGKGRRV